MRLVKKYMAPWCAPCNNLTPLLAKVAEQFGAEVEEVNIEDNAEEAKALGIRTIPTLYLYEDGVVVASRNGVGNITESNLVEMFTTAYGSTKEG